MRKCRVAFAGETFTTSIPLDSIVSYTPMINKRTNDLLEALANRRDRGIVDVSLALNHWTHDVTVSVLLL